MITWDDAIERAAILQNAGMFTTVPLYKLAERIQHSHDVDPVDPNNPPDLMTNNTTVYHKDSQ